MVVKSAIDAGVCGFKTTVTALSAGMDVNLTIETSCGHVKKLAEAMGSINPMTEIFSGLDKSAVYAEAGKCGLHTACPVPCGIIKAIEAAAGLALPKDVAVSVTKE